MAFSSFGRPKFQKSHVISVRSDDQLCDRRPRAPDQFGLIVTLTAKNCNGIGFAPMLL